MIKKVLNVKKSKVAFFPIRTLKSAVIVLFVQKLKTIIVNNKEFRGPRSKYFAKSAKANKL